jgi:hypothetical protein
MVSETSLIIKEDLSIKVIPPETTNPDDAIVTPDVLSIPAEFTLIPFVIVNPLFCTVTPLCTFIPAALIVNPCVGIIKCPIHTFIFII